LKISASHSKEILSNHGLKATHQRIVILQALMETESHPNAEQIHDKIKKAFPSISLATVYKTLDSFVQNNLAEKVLTDTDHVRYDCKVHEHNHIYCTNTGEIIDYEDNELQILIKKHLQSKNIENLEIEKIKLVITGKKTDLKQSVFIK
jgi:Fur family transcriptional regulator, peroxide stress response regulator